MNDLGKKKRVFRRLAGTGIIVLCLFLLAAGFWWDVEASTLDVCLVHRLTGLDCPGCGMTRAFHCLLHLRIADALDYNVFSPVVFLLIAALIVTIEADLLLDKKLFQHVPPWPLVALLAALLVFGVVRNIPIEPFTYLHT
ncbi:MAG: DUF2752 domain-containing protein [Eubacteriales bacterium]|nr:DUF2752 domain-containing protein [Eubacteriales bacterium]